MNCLLVFDHVNDIVYSKYNRKFLDHLKDFAVTQGLIAEKNENSRIDGNIIVQIFSPIIASQRIMNCQFGNSYTSIQCEDNLNICFDEFMGYLFVAIGQNEVSSIKRYLSVCITIVRYICGPDILQLRDKPATSTIVTKLMDSWNYLYNNDQSILVEAVEQLTVNSDLSSSVIKALSESVGKLMPILECNKIHAILMVQNKFLSLYSSPNAKELSSADIIFITILLQSSSLYTAASSSCNDEFYSPVATPETSKPLENPTGGYKVLLAGSNYSPQCLPHIVHIVPLSGGINLIYLLEVGNSAVASNIYETFCHLHTMQFVQIQRDIETMRPAVENLDIATKKLSDSLKKTKNSAVEACYKQLIKKWEITRKKYQDFIKTSSDEALLRAETLILGFLENLKQLFTLTAIDDNLIEITRRDVLDAAQQVHEKLSYYTEFFQVKALKNFSLGSRDSLTIIKYLEEFPGLVHFIYIDRTSHRITSPTLENSSDETHVLTKKKIWQMVEFSKNHLQEGNLSLMWKDTIFNYSYFLWFEDSSGAPLKPIVHPMNSTKLLPLPGLFCCDFYQKLKETCFPKMAPSKIRCYELYCIHLGLVTAACVLEHTRRMAATIWELKGRPNHPIDLL